MTYSIVARDAATGDLGVAMQTGILAGGAAVPWVRAGVGAVATQAIEEPAYGPRCLDAMAEGASAKEALAGALELDPLREWRQIGVVGSDGSVAAMTGSIAIPNAGDKQGKGYTVQANMMASTDVWPAMAAAYESAEGPLARRLHAALVAAEGAGGDARGPMSAALVVVSGSVPDAPGRGTVVDVRVDRSEDPVGELAHLLDAHDAYVGFGSAVEQLFMGDPPAAVATLDAALAKFPHEENLRFIRAGALAASGALDAGIAEVRSLLADRPSWAVVVRGFAEKGLFAVPAGMDLDEVLSVADD